MAHNLMGQMEHGTMETEGPRYITKFLCICQYGHSRSVCLCRALHARGYEAVAVGLGTAPSAITVLADWADEILVLEPHFSQGLLVRHLPKVKVFDVGPDRWSNPYDPELRKILDQMIDKEGW